MNDYADTRFLLLQVRKPDDPMLAHEVRSFSAALPCDPRQIVTADLITGAPDDHLLADADVILIGGSGDFSVTHEAAWLDRTYELIRELRRRRLPTFGSCWGFQAIAKALGGTVVHDLARAELGTPEVTLTDAGREDPIFGPLGNRFTVPVGHEDTVVQLPECCSLLAESPLAYHVLCVNDAPIYATQFHPELDRDGFFERVRQYPRYVESILGISVKEFAGQCQETPKMREILPRFLEWVL